MPFQVLLPFGLFLFLAGDNLLEYFGGDDVMNLYQYLKSPFSHWVAGIFHFWSSGWYRPLGGIVYLILFRVFGLHPLPYKILLFAAILFNMALYLKVAAKLTNSLHVAAWALLLCAYHAAMDGLYLDFGTIYDVLGYSFFFGAIAIYMAWIAIPRRLAAGSALIVVFYILGLCAKEIVVTLPAVLLLYNLLLTHSIAKERWRWPLRSGLAIVVCFALGALYSLGKTHGPDSLARDPLYTPHFTLHQYALTTSYYMHLLFYLPWRLPTPTGAIWILAALIGLALLLRSRLMLFSAGAIVLTQLPISFIAVRNGFVLYLAFGFWALYAAVLMDRVLPLIRNPAWSFAAFLALAGVLCAVHLHMKAPYDTPYTQQTRAYENLAAHLEHWDFHIPPQGKVLLVNDPFPANWITYDSLFLISLYAHTTSATVTRLKFNPVMVPLQEIDSYDYVIDYDSTWRLLKSPGHPLVNRSHLQMLAGAAPIELLDGFELPTADNWRYTRPLFTIRVGTGAQASVVYVHLQAMSPAKVTASLDGGALTSQTAQRPSDIDFLLPVPAGRHTLVFQVSGESDAKPVVLFMDAELRPSP